MSACRLFVEALLSHYRRSGGELVRQRSKSGRRVQLARCRYRKQFASYPVKRLKFIDESGLNIAMTRRYGRAMRGQRVHDAVPKNFGRNVSILGSLSW